MTSKYPALRDRLRVQHGFYMILCVFDPVTGTNPDVPEFGENKVARNTCRMVVETCYRRHGER
jgi:hypothetical protein